MKRFRVRCTCGTTTSFPHRGAETDGADADFTCVGCEKVVTFTVPPLIDAHRTAFQERATLRER